MKTNKQRVRRTGYFCCRIKSGSSPLLSCIPVSTLEGKKCFAYELGVNLEKSKKIVRTPS